MPRVGWQAARFPRLHRGIIAYSAEKSSPSAGPAAQLLQEAEYYPFSVIDEFGGFEMVIPQYRQQLAAFLSSDQPCVGVLKTTEEAQKARDLFGLGEKYTMLIQNLHQVLAQDSDTVLLKTSGCGDETARRILRQWIKEFVNG